LGAWTHVGISGAGAARYGVVAVPLWKAATRRGTKNKNLKHGNPKEKRTGLLAPPAITRRSDIGAGVAIDFHADGDFDHAGRIPGHWFLLVDRNEKTLGTHASDSKRMERAGARLGRIPPRVVISPLVREKFPHEMIAISRDR